MSKEVKIVTAKFLSNRCSAKEIHRNVMVMGRMVSRISIKAAPMTNTTRPTPAEIRALRAENPKMRERDTAAQLGISEAALVAAEVGLTAVRIDGSANRFLERSEGLGEVMALTRNESVVHEKIGVFEKITTGKHASIVLGENIDLRICRDQDGRRPGAPQPAVFRQGRHGRAQGAPASRL
jgi:hypothetical protein